VTHYGTWDRPTDTWDAPGLVWQAPPPWAWWVQSRAAIVTDITAKVIEARWTSDSYTMGDGTWRGDLQPGRLQLRMFDPGDTVLSELNTIWANYRPWGDPNYPTGHTFAWFVEQVSRRLVAPGDPTGDQIVVTANRWPARLVQPGYGTDSQPAQTVTARLTALATRLGTDANLAMPPTTGVIATDTHQCKATLAAADRSQAPSILQLIRDAAANGIVTLDAVVDAVGVAGRLELRYQPWGTQTKRAVPQGQVIAGPVSARGSDTLVTAASFTGTDLAANQTLLTRNDPNWVINGQGWRQRGPMRCWANLNPTTGTDTAAARATLDAIWTANHSPDTYGLSSITAQSGRRTGPHGGPPAAVWDPQWMVVHPTHSLTWTGPPGPSSDTYRVVSSSHVLTAHDWQVVHTLQRDSPATQLPNP
jgi:hypothetical protein